MPRSRVLSFMSQWGGGQPRSPTPDAEKSFKSPATPANDFESVSSKRPPPVETASPQNFQRGPVAPPSPRSPTTPSRARGDSRLSTRPTSMIQTYQPPQVDVAQDTPPELQPIFGYLNSHSNKLYQEGYFLKLHDLDSRGRPSADRVWNECFAQLVGTVLSLWDAAALDQAGEDGEVVPTFINLSDASIKMIESLPMNGAQGGNLQNVLSVSTAANNRYLLHFNSLNSLTQWTAAIRLAMFEHATLQEAYTGSMIAGKGKFLNSIRQIMDRSRFSYEDWTRVRFGAGTPWKRYWCVINPPDEKEYQKSQKILKKSSTYSRALLPKGDIKFYDTRKVTKKTKPVATITDVYAAYAIYPQSKPLIDQSTLIKLEGLITLHGDRETTAEGFVFAMPEVHAAVSGFEMMLQWLFRVYDTFALYGRPTRLIADILDQRGLMFAMPRDRRYGYLDTLDVSALIHTDGSQNWNERQWRKEMKKLTAARMTAQLENPPYDGRPIGPRRNTTSRASLPPTRSAVQFQEPSIHSSPASRSGSPARNVGLDGIQAPRRTDSAPPSAYTGSPHKRAASDMYGSRRQRTEMPSRLSQEASRPDDYDDDPPAPPRHGGPLGLLAGRPPPLQREYSNDRSRPESQYEQLAAHGQSPNLPPPAPVISPPAMMHNANSQPPVKPYLAPELRRAHSNVDEATLHELQDAVHPDGPIHEHGTPQSFSANHHGNLPYRGQQSAPVRGRGAEFTAYADDGSGWQPHENRQRLSTIPGSPYVTQESEYFRTPEQAQMPQMEAVMGSGDASRGRPELTSLDSSHSISRKPVPNMQSQMAPEAEQTAPYQDQVRAIVPDSPDSPVSGGSFYDALVDQDALELLLNDESNRASTMASSATPDYASVESPPKQESLKKEKEWHRPGKLKTVGDPDLPTIDVRSGGVGKLDTYNRDRAAEAADLPTIDFGPTYTYKPSSRPGTSGTLGAGDKGKHRSRSRSADRLRQSAGSRLSEYFVTPSAGESNRNSYFAGASSPTGVEEAGQTSHRHSMAWAPGLSSGGPSPDGAAKRQTLTPEEWVAYRASLAAQTHAPHRRSPVSPLPHHTRSSTNYSQQVRQSMTRTPSPFARAASGDWSQGQNRTPPSRPSSRGAGAFLNQSPALHSNQSSVTLTAKEQMHISRATGTPLLNIGAKNEHPNEQAPGLVGALAAREKEKAALAQGIRTSMVEQAILARQQQQFLVEAEAQAHAHAQAQAQYEMQQRAQQEALAWQYQQQQMTYGNAMAMNYQPSPVPASQAQSAAASAYSHGRAQSTQLPMQQNRSGLGGQYVQQQGVQPQQQAYGGGNYYGTQQGQQSGQGRQWQPPRR